LAYVNNAPSEEGRKAALRSLIVIPVDWDKLEPAVDKLLRAPQLSSGMRAFAFGIVAFAVTQEKWKGQARDAALDFLCRVFTAEKDVRLAMQFVYSLGLILVYCNDEDYRKVRQDVRQRVTACLRRRASLGGGGGSAAERDLESQYQKLRAKYL